MRQPDEKSTLCSTWFWEKGRGMGTRPVLVVAGASREKARPLCDCDKDAELETDSVRDGVELHDASDCGEDSDEKHAELR